VGIEPGMYNIENVKDRADGLCPDHCRSWKLQYFYANSINGVCYFDGA